MQLPQAAPGEGARRKPTHWTYVGTPKKTGWHAWSAGPCSWFVCHVKGKTQPCVHWFTNGEVGCQRCNAGQDTEVSGYQPLYREVDTKPVLVIVHEYVREIVDAIPFRRRVYVSRGAEASDGVAVNAAPSPLPLFQTTLAERMKHADIAQSLLKIWRLPELVMWLNATQGNAVKFENAAPPKKKAPISVTPAAPVVDALPLPGEPDGAGDLGELLDVLKTDGGAAARAERNRLFLAKASSNGKPNKPR